MQEKRRLNDKVNHRQSQTVTTTETKCRQVRRPQHH